MRRAGFKGTLATATDRSQISRIASQDKTIQPTSTGGTFSREPSARYRYVIEPVAKVH
jgi:hypothetical protein